MRYPVDIQNERFGKLVAKEYVGIINHRHSWRCVCDCGNEKTISYSKLVNGEYKSCGCGKGIRHGYSKTRLYKIYNGMKKRCYNKSSISFETYGGKGITICDDWIGKNGFINFKNWSLANGYKDDLSIDRIDNSKGYSPENCRWSTPKEQCRNRTNNICLTLDGETHTLAEWSEIKNMRYETLRERFHYGWSAEEILTIPISKHNTHVMDTKSCNGM